MVRCADALCGEWNVFAVDLQNEPFKSSWGSGNPATDWNIGARVLGNHVLSHCQRWLVMVEGVADNPGVTGAYNVDHFWGENMEVRCALDQKPLSLPAPEIRCVKPHSNAAQFATHIRPARSACAYSAK